MGLNSKPVQFRWRLDFSDCSGMLRLGREKRRSGQTASIAARPAVLFEGYATRQNLSGTAELAGGVRINAT